MLQLSLSCRPRCLGAGLLFLLTTVVTVPCAFSQTAIAGYTSTWSGTAPASAYPFLSFSSAETVIVVPFAINSLGSYVLTSTSLLLRAVPQHGGSLPVDDPLHPGNHGPDLGGGGVDLQNVSVRVFSTLPNSLTLPSALATFSIPSSGAGESPAVSLYTSNSAPTFTAGQTYYLAVSIGSSSTLEWDMITGDSSGGTYPGDNPVTSLIGDGTPLVYYKITSSGVQNFYDNAGGFAIAANAVIAIPEPAAGGILAGAGVLAMALVVRGHRRRCVVADEVSHAGG